MKDKYEKVILGVAALIAVAMIALGVMKLGAVEEEFPPATENPSGANPIEVEDIVSRNVQTLSSPITMDQKRTAQGRGVDTFTGVNLYVRKGADANQTVDPDAPGEKPVHPPIPNSWWEKNGLGKEMGYGNAPQLDSDKDGFSNLEEFNEKTNPNDKNSFPSLFAKVKVASIEKEQFLLRFSDYGGGSMSFRIKGTVDQGKRAVENRMRGGKVVAPGGIFFEDDPYKERFKFVEAFEKEVRNIPKTFARVEDLKEGKGNRVYEIPAGAHDLVQSDYTARLYLDTPDQKGNVVGIEEGMSFALPFDENAAEKPYTLKEIGQDGTTALLLWENDGETKELQLQVEN